MHQCLNHDAFPFWLKVELCISHFVDSFDRSVMAAPAFAGRASHAEWGEAMRRESWEKDTEANLFADWQMANMDARVLEPGMFTSDAGWADASAAANRCWEALRDFQSQMKFANPMYTDSLLSYQWASALQNIPSGLHVLG